MLESYRNIPLNLDPAAFSAGSFSIGWYALMYLAAFFVVWSLLSYRLKKKEASWGKGMLLDLASFSFLGALIGGRLGYVLIYNPGYYAGHLVEIFSPYDFGAGRWIGIYGMSYHGGLIGVAAAIFLFLRFFRKKEEDFWKLADFIVPAIPAGYFFGRIGNFLNGELYGRVTDSPIGMYFFSEGGGIALRYPSQLIEAFLEGLVLFAILWPMRNRKRFGGYFVSLYLIGYGTARMVGEFFREPDPHIGFFFGLLTLGQFLSFLMIIIGAGLYFRRRKKVV